MTLDQYLDPLLEHYGTAGEPVRFAADELLRQLFPHQGALAALVNEVLGVAHDHWRHHRCANLQQTFAADQLSQVATVLMVVQGELGGLFHPLAATLQQGDLTAVDGHVQHFITHHGDCWRRAREQLTPIAEAMDALRDDVARTEDLGQAIHRALEAPHTHNTPHQRQALTALAHLERTHLHRDTVTLQILQALQDPDERLAVGRWLPDYWALPAEERTARLATATHLGELGLIYPLPEGAEVAHIPWETGSPVAVSQLCRLDYFTLGRSGDLCLASHRPHTDGHNLSRRHLTFRWLAGNLEVQDTSSNGALYNGHRLPRDGTWQPLATDDELTVLTQHIDLGLQVAALTVGGAHLVRRRDGEDQEDYWLLQGGLALAPDWLLESAAQGFVLASHHHRQGLRDGDAVQLGSRQGTFRAERYRPALPRAS